MSGATPGVAANYVDGEWSAAAATRTIPDPLNGEPFLVVPDTSAAELGPFVASMKKTPKSGLHNPLKDPGAYFALGEVNALIGAELRKPDVENFFAELLQRVVPKHDAQVLGEVTTVRKWVEGFAGDGVRRLASASSLPGDRPGQETRSYRWPYGATSVITPFNFPLEIPALQSLASVFMGNKCTVKVDERVQIVYEQFLRMCLACGMPPKALDLIYCGGPVCNELLVRGDAKMTLFTGSQHVAEKLTIDLRGRVKLEDAGFDWKILGPDVMDEEYVTWQADQDAYAFSGQKCSAQSICFVHENWEKAGFVESLKETASKRSLDNLSAGPVLSWSTKRMLDHVEAVSSLPGAKVVFGGKKLPGSEKFPEQYGGLEPTAVEVPLDTMLATDENFATVTTELFGPFQVLVPYKDSEIDSVLEACERMTNHLTAAVVSNDATFVNEVRRNRAENDDPRGGVLNRTGWV